MAFFFMAVIFMYVGRKVGWLLSRAILCTASPAVSGAVGSIWGCAIALTMFWLIRWQEPNIFLKVIMGYALGWYIAIPNFGLSQNDSATGSANPRNVMVSTGPPLVYIVTMVVLSFSV